MKSLSIRWKFALWSAALLTFSLIIYSAATLFNLFHEQVQSVDLELMADGQRFSELRPLSLAQESAAEMTRFESWLAFALFDEAGGLKVRSDRFPEAIARQALNQTVLQTVKEGRKRWRLGAFPTAGATFVVAYDLAEVQETIHNLIVAYALSVPIVVVIAAAGGWWVSGRALIPVRDLTLAAESVQAGRLDRRVPVPKATDEIHRLSVVLNAMLERLEKSFEQARRFAADASHELRTPLTIMRGEIEQLVHAPNLSHLHVLKLVSLQEEIDRLQRITENLLLLARLDAGRVPLNPPRVDLKSLVDEACEDAELLGAAHQVEIVQGRTEALFVFADAAHLRRALLNLLDNAVKFNDSGGRVTCELTQQGDFAQCVVGNTGEGIPEELRSRLFQRFFRADSSRGESRGGHGLGLSLSREIARAYGGDLELVSEAPAGWVYFRLTLPLAAKNSPRSVVEAV